MTIDQLGPILVHTALINPSQEVPAQEEALLNGETPAEPTTDDGLVNFMHDSQLDRSESQLSPHAPEFQPSSSPDLVDQPEKGNIYSYIGLFLAIMIFNYYVNSCLEF